MFEDLTGKTFGQPHMIKHAEPLEWKSSKKRSFWLCRCLSCGMEKKIMARQCLKKAKSCGCVRNNTRKEPGPSGFKKKLAIYKRGTRQRGYAWDLSDLEFRELTSSNCKYCGRPPSQISDAKGTRGYSQNGIEYSRYRYNGIDRVNNDLGYTKMNCVPYCSQCNWAKRDLSAAEFVDWIKAVGSNLQLHIN